MRALEALARDCAFRARSIDMPESVVGTIENNNNRSEKCSNKIAQCLQELTRKSSRLRYRRSETSNLTILDRFWNSKKNKNKRTKTLTQNKHQNEQIRKQNSTWDRRSVYKSHQRGRQLEIGAQWGSVVGGAMIV